MDMGTNSTRLLVADVEGSGAEADVKTLERLMTITRLGEGVASTRRLSSAGIERVCVVLREYRGVMESLGVERVRATATSAARDAENRDEFVKAVEDALGFAPEIITGEEEAALSFLGATAGLDAPGPFLVVDIGGGSTEFVVGTDKPEGLIS
ncbi:MAG: exopolyphosphatase, partial [Acidimicrobiia bacterium]|nr:exopolyphosphatase [Acidimicrobiia bacterium]